LTIALEAYDITPDLSKGDLIMLDEKDAETLKKHPLTPAVDIAKQIGVRFRVAVEA
jgi:hypothetical protein